MKCRSVIVKFTIILSCVWMIPQITVIQAATVYDNITNAKTIRTFAAAVGDTLHLAGTERLVTQVSFGVVTNGGIPVNTDDFQVRLFAADRGDGGPGTLLWQSNFLTDVSLTGSPQLISFDVPKVQVPDIFVWTVNHADTGDVGFLWANPPTIGSSPDYAWSGRDLRMQGPYHTTPANFMVRVEAISEAILTDLEIVGPNEVPDNNSTQYVAIAFYSDGSSADVTEEASWFVGANNLATIDANGILKTQELEILQELIFISAKYAENDVNVTDEKDVLIFADCSITELIGRNVRGAIDIKQKILESLSKALEKEERAKSMLEEFSEHPSFSNWSKNDMIGLGQKLSWSIKKENHSQGALNESLKKLQEAQQIIAD